MLCCVARWQGRGPSKQVQGKQERGWIQLYDGQTRVWLLVVWRACAGWLLLEPEVCPRHCVVCMGRLMLLQQLCQ